MTPQQGEEGDRKEGRKGITGVCSVLHVISITFAPTKVLDDLLTVLRNTIVIRDRRKDTSRYLTRRCYHREQSSNANVRYAFIFHASETSTLIGIIVEIADENISEQTDFR